MVTETEIVSNVIAAAVGSSHQSEEVQATRRAEAGNAKSRHRTGVAQVFADLGIEQ